MGNLCDSQSDPHANPDCLAVEAVEAKAWTPAAENIGLKPALIRVAFRPLDIHFEPDLDSSKLIFDAPLGSFWVPIAVGRVEWGGRLRMAYQIEKHLPANADGQMAFYRGWIVDFAGSDVSAIEVTFEDRLEAAARRLSTEEAREMREALAGESVTGSMLGGWIQSSPLHGQLPHLVRVVGDGLSVRQSPEYNSDKLCTGFLDKIMNNKTHIDLGEELTPLEHRQEVHESVVINFYRVRVTVAGQDRQGWLLDYSPGQCRRTLEILYN